MPEEFNRLIVWHYKLQEDKLTVRISHTTFLFNAD